MNKSIDPVDIILLCGGKGTRFYEITNDKFPKSLYQLNGIELIDFTIKSLDMSLVRSLIFAVDHQAGAVISWSQNQRYTCPTYFSFQAEPGVLGAVKSALSHVTSKSFIVCNTDEVRDNLSMKEMLRIHNNAQSLATMVTLYSDHLYQYRVIQEDSDHIIVGTELKNLEYKENDNIIKQINSGFIAFKREAASFFDDSYGNDWSSLIDPLVAKRLIRTALNRDIRYFNVGTAQELKQAQGYVTSKVYRHEVELLPITRRKG